MQSFVFCLLARARFWKRKFTYVWFQKPWCICDVTNDKHQEYTRFHDRVIVFDRYNILHEIYTICCFCVFVVVRYSTTCNWYGEYAYTLHIPKGVIGSSANYENLTDMDEIEKKWIKTKKKRIVHMIVEKRCIQKLTHWIWGRVTHICVSKLTIISSNKPMILYIVNWNLRNKC